MFGLHGAELIFIIVAIFLLFGARRLPQIAKAVGQTRKAFKEGTREAAATELPQNRNSSPEKVVSASRLSDLSDEQILAEMRRRVQLK